MIEQLIAQENAYAVTAMYCSMYRRILYGNLSKRSLEDMLVGVLCRRRRLQERRQRLRLMEALSDEQPGWDSRGAVGALVH